jgi:lipoprotein-anchoring transpeptidase ErfK/SrfK
VKPGDEMVFDDRLSAMRRVFFWLTLAFFMCATEARAIETGTQKSPQTRQLQPGDYVWQPQISPDGPIVILVDLSRQLLQVYRNGVEIGRSFISAGVASHETPTGIFTILQKRITHHSNTYHEASMPFTERLTWGGLAIHAGGVPGHPESHGCVHVPLAFAQKLYGVTVKGATVLITGGGTTGGPEATPALEFATTAGTHPPPAGAPFAWHPEAAHSGSLSVVYSSADQQLTIYRGGIEIGQAKTGSAGPAVGDRVYVALAQTYPTGFHEWKLLGSLESSPAPDAATLLQQLAIAPAFLADMRQTVIPGTTLVLTDEPVNEKSHAGGSDILDTASE